MRFREAVLSQIRAVYDGGTSAGLTDRQLLARFADRDGEGASAAFAALVERHGPMVLRVCRASLHDEHDATDAFQAVFLVLVQKAGTLWVRDSLGPWLHAVAVRTSARVRVRNARRRLHEQRRAESAVEVVNRCPAAGELALVVNQEIVELPGRLREAVVLCDLEGLSHAEAASRLGCPVGTIKSRQARGRDRLRARLSRRGVGPEDMTAVILAPLRPVGESLLRSLSRAFEAMNAGRVVTSGSMTASAIALASEVSGRLTMTRILTRLLPALAAGAFFSGAVLLAAGHPWSQPPPASGGPANPAAEAKATAPRPPAGSVLQLRIVADRTHDADARDGNGYRWVKVHPRCTGPFEGLVTREEEGKVVAILVRVDPQNVTERDVERVALDQDERGQPEITFYLTPDGGKRLRSLTHAHLPENNGAFRYHLAVIADGAVAFMPLVLGEIGDAAVIQFGGGPDRKEVEGLVQRLRDAAAYNAPPIRGRGVNDQDEALREAEAVDIPALAAADRVTIDWPTGKRVSLASRGAVDSIRRTLRAQAVRPGGGDVAATLRFYQGDELIRSVWVSEGGEWGFERPGTRWATGSDAELWRLIEARTVR